MQADFFLASFASRSRYEREKQIVTKKSHIGICSQLQQFSLFSTPIKKYFPLHTKSSGAETQCSGPVAGRRAEGASHPEGHRSERAPGHG